MGRVLTSQWDIGWVRIAAAFCPTCTVSNMRSIGTYKLLPKQVNRRPAYRFLSPEWGVAYLYFESLKTEDRYWVVGPELGSADVNLGAASHVTSPDQVLCVRI